MINSQKNRFVRYVPFVFIMALIVMSSAASAIDSKLRRSHIPVFASPILEFIGSPISVRIEDILNPPEVDSKNLWAFADNMGFRESGNRYHIVNRLGYMGKYQFGKSTLFELGPEYRVKRSIFLSTPSLQDSAFVDLLRKNRRSLLPIIKRYEGTVRHGITITESGLLAAAHLVGSGGVRAYFDPTYTVTIRGNEIRPRLSDGNGVKAEEYIRDFSGYSMKLLD